MTLPQPVDSALTATALACCAVLGFSSPNPWEVLWSSALLLLLLRWFWWQNQPGIMLYCILIPFVEIHTTLIEANQNDLTLNGLFFGTGRSTFWMSSVSLLAVAIGVRTLWASSSRRLFFTLDDLTQAADQLNQKRLVLAFFSAKLIGEAMDFAIPYASGFRQLETYALGISDAILMVIAIKFMLDRKHTLLVILIFTCLIALSFFSFFSDWKGPLSILLVASLTGIRTFNVRQALRLSPILLPAFLLLFVWQSIKGEYRAYLNGGKYSQHIVVTQTDALLKFQELASDAIATDIFNERQINATYRRVGYLEYFSSAVSKVPAEIPHQSGQLLQSNLTFSLLPRILAPDKGIKNDQAKVERYTDFAFSPYGGSSFSLGHYCEAYIDWGRYGMLIHLFLFGMLGGGLYLITLSRAVAFNPLLALGLLWVCMKPWGTFQSDMVTVSGQVFWGAICHLIIFFPFYRLANDWIQHQSGH